ncbi:methanol oxidation system protein MoxJ [Rhodopseudomonas palustris]|uniref:Extracellular solute-binding protein, family 3 n=1 Tax=Rhodopseudomonas palustris (strain BisB18) TaxID=316056 RepID=Q217H1_RHOPB
MDRCGGQIREGRTTRRAQGVAWRCGALLVALGLGFVPALASDEDPYADDKTVLRVCAASEEEPYSVKDGSGFENKVAEALAAAMGRKAVFKWYNKPAIYLVRDQLSLKLCDVVVGLDTGDQRVLTSAPYYRAPYVFIQRKDSKLSIKDWNSPDLAKADKIGFVPGSPAQTMMEKIGLFNVHFNYMHSLTDFQDRRNKYTRISPRRVVGEVANGTANAAVMFAPEVARYVKANAELAMTVIPDDNVGADGAKIPHHFDQSFGVREDDRELRDAIDAALPKARPKIEAILAAEGIPLLPMPKPQPPRGPRS